MERESPGLVTKIDMYIERGRSKLRRGREGLVPIVMEIKDLSAYSACSPPLLFGRRE